MGSLDRIEIAFTKIPKVTNLKYCYNLIEISCNLSLLDSLVISTSTESLAGLESVSHSLETLRVIDCRVNQIEECFHSLT
jgi:hypothetical protein